MEIKVRKTDIHIDNRRRITEERLDKSKRRR